MKEINLKKAMQAYAEMETADTWMIHLNNFKSVSDREKERCEFQQAEAHKAFDEATEDLTKILDEVQHRCSARIITARDICRALRQIDGKLDITKKAMDGVTVAVDLNAQNFPGKYKGIPMSTIFEARYKSGSWRITDIYRAETRAQSNGCTVNLTEEAEAAILANFQTLSI